MVVIYRVPDHSKLVFLDEMGTCERSVSDKEQNIFVVLVDKFGFHTTFYHLYDLYV